MLRRFKFGLLSLATAGLLTLGLSHPAHATLQVGINGSSAGSSATNGIVSLNFTSGIFTVTGSADGPGVLGAGTVDLSTTTITSTGAGTITIVVNVTGLTSPSGAGTLSETITGHEISGGSFTSSFVSVGDNSNTSTLGPATPPGTQTPAVTTLNGSSSVAFTAVPTYALDQVLTFTFSGAGQISISSDATTTFAAVPEPSSMAIAGLGALGMIGYGLRRRKALGA